MKAITIYLLLIVNSIISIAQCDSSFFRYTGSFINDMSVVTDNVIVAVGDNGYIIKSTDGGNNWRDIHSPFYGVHKNIQFSSLNTGYVVGASGILKTEDQGDSWFPIATTTLYANSFNCLYFFDDDTGFFGGSQGHLLSTNDGGRTLKDTMMGANDFFAMDFLDRNQGLIAGQNSIYKTTDGGRTWKGIDVSNIGYNPVINKIKYISSSIVVAVGSQGLFMKSTDGGSTWTKYNTPAGDGPTYYDFYFFDQNKGLILGNYSGGVIYYTADGGNSFQVNYNYPTRYASYYTAKPDPHHQKLFIAGGGASSEWHGYNGRNIILTTDEGDTWTSLSSNGRIDYGSIDLINDSTVIIGGESQMLKTSDYGESWKQMQMPPSQSGTGFWLFSYIDNLNGFVINSDMYKTSDGGNSWQMRSKPQPVGNGFYGNVRLLFLDSLNGFMSDMYGISKTNDGALSWKLVATPTSTNFFKDCFFTADGKGFAVGYGGEMQVSADKGDTWKPFNLSLTDYFTSVYFYNNKLGFIGTADSTVYKTVNGGKTWNKINTKTHGLQMVSFYFTDSLHGFFLTNNNNGSITSFYETLNGGLTWTFLRTESENTTRIVGDRTLYLVGTNGLIIKTARQKKPSVPGYITGPQRLCVKDKSSYSTPDAGLQYVWTLSDGGTQKMGKSSDTIIWNAGGQHFLSVKAYNSCGTGPERILPVDVIDFKPSISDSSGILKTSAGIHYKWYYNNTLVKEGSTDSARTFIPSNAGPYRTEVTNEYGCTGSSDTLNFVLALPLQILSFSGKFTSDNHVQLDWKTANEKYAGFEVIERSSDSLHFSPVDSLPAKNNYSSEEPYSLLDRNASRGMNFYRLKISQASAPDLYSEIIAVKGSNTPEPIIYPNPARNTLIINQGSESILEVDIFNSQGSVVFKQKYSGLQNVITINITDLPSGQYFVKIKTAQSEYNLSLVVIK